MKNEIAVNVSDLLSFLLVTPELLLTEDRMRWLNEHIPPILLRIFKIVVFCIAIIASNILTRLLFIYIEFLADWKYIMVPVVMPVTSILIAGMLMLFGSSAFIAITSWVNTSGVKKTGLLLGGILFVVTRMYVIASAALE